MARPLKKDVNGTEVLGTYVSDAGIKCEFYDGSTNQTDGIIIKQRGATTFVVARVGTPNTRFACSLVSATPSAAGQMRIRGYNAAGSGQGAQVTANLVAIRKLTRRIAYGFPSSPVTNSGGFQNSEDSNASTNHDEAKYTWYLSNDSSSDYLVLTPFTTKM
jgi:hypothetical protein